MSISPIYKFYVEAYTTDHKPLLGTAYSRIYYNKRVHNTWWYNHLLTTKPNKVVGYYVIKSCNNTNVINCDKEYKIEEYLINPKYKEELLGQLESGIKVSYINSEVNNHVE